MFMRTMERCSVSPGGSITNPVQTRPQQSNACHGGVPQEDVRVCESASHVPGHGRGQTLLGCCWRRAGQQPPVLVRSTVGRVRRQRIPRPERLSGGAGTRDGRGGVRCRSSACLELPVLRTVCAVNRGKMPSHGPGSAEKPAGWRASHGPVQTPSADGWAGPTVTTKPTGSRSAAAVGITRAIMSGPRRGWYEQGRTRRRASEALVVKRQGPRAGAALAPATNRIRHGEEAMRTGRWSRRWRAGEQGGTGKVGAEVVISGLGNELEREIERGGALRVETQI